MEEYSGQEQKGLFRIVRRRAVVGAALIFLGLFVVQIMVYAIMMSLIPFFLHAGTGDLKASGIPELFKDDRFRHLFSEWFYLILSVCCIVWCGFLYLRSDWRSKMDYRKVFGKKHLQQIFLCGFCGCFFMIMFLTVMQRIFPAFFAEYQKGMDDFNTGSVSMLLYALLLGPVAEELIFRGAIFDRLYLALPFSIANFLQAFLFAVYHKNLVQGIYAFLFGLLLGLLHHTGGSIWNDILAHILFNLSNYLIPVIYVVTVKKSIALFVTVAFICSFGFAFGVISLLKENREK